MSRSRPRRRTVVAFSGGAVAVLAVAAVLGGGPVRACSAVGFANISPIELTTSLRIDEVAACFGRDCQPVTLTAQDGAWSVPQTAELLQHTEPGSVTHLKVEASYQGHVVAEEIVEIGRERDGGTAWPECPGPYRYLPVSIGR